MASLTIGGQTWELALSALDVAKAEQKIIQEGGRTLLATLATTEVGRGWFAMTELHWFVWAAWRRQAVPDARITALLEQFYREGGTLFEVHQQVLEALLESGLLGRRTPTNGAGPPPDPPGAGTSA